ncbi:hypothetical protein IIB34_03585 [PVC group bacterium]|nr:hypothetical protein [PVC group bacterium]
MKVIKTSSGDDVDYGYAVVGGLETIKSTLSPLIFMLKLELFHGRENQYNVDALTFVLRYSKVMLQYIEKDRPSVISMLEHDNYQTYSEYLNKQIGYYDRMYSLFESTIEDISFWIQELENREIKEL